MEGKVAQGERPGTGSQAARVQILPHHPWPRPWGGAEMFGVSIWGLEVELAVPASEGDRFTYGSDRNNRTLLVAGRDEPWLL